MPFTLPHLPHRFPAQPLAPGSLTCWCNPLPHHPHEVLIGQLLTFHFTTYDFHGVFALLSTKRESDFSNKTIFVSILNVLGQIALTDSWTKKSIQIVFTQKELKGECIKECFDAIHFHFDDLNISEQPKRELAELLKVSDPYDAELADADLEQAIARVKAKECALATYYYNRSEVDNFKIEFRRSTVC